MPVSAASVPGAPGSRRRTHDRNEKSCGAIPPARSSASTRVATREPAEYSSCSRPGGSCGPGCAPWSPRASQATRKRDLLLTGFALARVSELDVADRVLVASKLDTENVRLSSLRAGGMGASPEMDLQLLEVDARDRVGEVRLLERCDLVLGQRQLLGGQRILHVLELRRADDRRRAARLGAGP